MENNSIRCNYISYAFQQRQSTIPYDSDSILSFDLNTLLFDTNNVLSYSHEEFIINIHQNQSSVPFDEVEVETNEGEGEIHTQPSKILSFYSRQLVDSSKGIFLIT